jgi:hypothetical protein
MENLNAVRVRLRPAVSDDEPTLLLILKQSTVEQATDQGLFDDIVR